MSKKYLGDSVYVEAECGLLKLTTKNKNRYGASNTIFLEPQVYAALVRYVDELRKPAAREAGDGDAVDTEELDAFGDVLRAGEARDTEEQ